MTALIDLFRSLSTALDQLVVKVDADLPLADDIHPAIRKVGDYAADMVRLPVELADLEARLASVRSSVPARDKAVRAARHAVVTTEAALKKLQDRIDYNRSVLTDDDLKPAPKPTSSPFGAFVPSRLDIIEGLRKEILATEDKLAKARDVLKRAEAFRKGVDTRAANLAKKIDDARKAVADHAARLEETVKLLRKTIAHLQNRQTKRDRKREAKTAIPVTVVEDVPRGPSDEDIRKMAESMGLPIETSDDLEAARQLFFN